MSAPPELLPCPFCGDPARMQVDGWGGWLAGCDGHDCGVLGPARELQSEAAEVWNTRASEPPVQGCPPVFTRTD